MSINPNNPNQGGKGLSDIGPTLTKQVSKGDPNQSPDVGKHGLVGPKPKLTTGGKIPEAFA